mmetsp:Transcript_75872/g.138267  ORF Transcript_75872/g.138267 Transcript_75872/m.138267 type:complete len:272 (-) Transcript_75872:99-914(-)
MGNASRRRRPSDPQGLQASLGTAGARLDEEADNDIHRAQASAGPGRWAWMPYGRRGLQRGDAYAREDLLQGIPAQLARPPIHRRFTPPTPSTATPPSSSPGVSGSHAMSSPDEWEAGSEASWGPGQESEDQRLSQARQRAKDSAEALRMQLQGFGDAMSLRYAVWPKGARVRVKLETSPEDEQQDVPAEPRFLQARIVCYNSSEKTFEVSLRDGSTRVVPEKRVERIRKPSKNSRREAPSSVAAGSSRGALLGWPENGMGLATSSDQQLLT